MTTQIRPDFPKFTPPQRKPEKAYEPRQMFLPFSPPDLGEDEIAEVVSTLRTGWITTGPKTKQFETEFARFLGARGALALNSCTAGLHVALATLGIGEGDEVITTPMTFAASANVIEHVRARPVLVDVQSDTLNIDPEAIERAITPRTRAILPVHYAGHPVDLDAIDAIARPRAINVIEDAAHALPATFRGQPIGSGGNPVAFSFYATKNLTTGEGGMLSGDPEFLDRARMFSLHGMSRDAWSRYAKGGNWFYEIITPGFKYNMTDLQAALGLVQLRRLEGFMAKRRAIVAAYNEAFAEEGVLECPVEREYVGHAWHLYVLRLHLDRLKIDRAQFITELANRQIGASVHFIPLHVHPFYRDRYGFTPSSFPVAFDGYNRMLSLPLNTTLTSADVGHVVDAVKDIIKIFRR